jgi:hypothetical protein
MFKKVVKILLISLLVLVTIAFAAPYLFKSQIVSLVKKEINKNINAKVDFEDVDISFFRSFPKVAVGLDKMEVTGDGVFANDTLFSAKRIDAALDIMSVIKQKDMAIYDVTVQSPRIHAIVNKDSLVNWDIMKADTATATESINDKPFKMALRHYAIRNAYISYKDSTADIGTEIFNLDHEGTGDFTSDLFTLKTSTRSDAVTVTYGGIAYLSNAKAVADADIQIDNKTKTYSFNTDKISVNDLKVTAKGAVKDLAENGYDMDIAFNAPSTHFKNILSLVPAIYQNDFSKIKTSGTAIFSGFVKGIYNEKSLPAYHVDVEVKDGFFQYPDLPKPLQKINIKAQIDNPDGVTDNTVVNIERAHIEMDNDPFDIRLLVKKPVSNTFVDAAAKGKLDLSKVAQLVKLEAGTKLSGLLNADVYVKGNVKDIEQQKFDLFTAGGVIDLTNFLYVAKDYPTGVKINTLATTFTPSKVDIKTLSGQYMSTNFNGSGQINNLLNYMLQNRPLVAGLNLNADNVNLGDWMSTSADTTTKGPAAAPFVVPDNLDVSLNTHVDKLHYDNVDISNLSGNLKITNETVTIGGVKGNALDGMVAINGSYSTRESKTNPAISLEYNVDKVDVQKTFAAFNTVQQLMPIAKFIAGKLTSRLTLKGKLGDNMMPDLTTLTGDGNVLLIEGFLSKFAPLDKIASTLNIKALEQISLKDVKTYFEFSNGKMLVKPFKVKVEGVDMEIGGIQGFDQSLDYIINMKVPRALMGEKGNQMANNLVTQINNKGVPLKLGDVINFNLLLGGYIKDPTIKTDVKQVGESMAEQLKQQAVEFAMAKIDSTKQAVTSAVKDTIASVKNQAIEAAKDELAKQLLGNKSAAADSTKPKLKPEESVKGLVKDLFKKKPKAAPVADTTAAPKP